MNPNRSTVRESALSLLNIVERGGTEDWKGLYKKCHDPAIAAQLATVLKMAPPDLLGCARLWKYLLEDLQPGLRVDLAAEQVNSPGGMK